MLMYKPKEENLLKQRQSLKQRQMLRQKTANSLTKTQLRQKMKLIIYTKDNKFYIDHSAAYALKMTNVRAVMVGKPHLIEVGLEALAKFKNNENLEIEYHKINNDIEITENEVDLLNELDSLKQETYGIGVHGIASGNNEEKTTTAESIFNDGLNMNNNSKTILSTSVSFGTTEDLQNISQAVKNYNYGTGMKVNVIIAVPQHIQNKNGDMIFLGFPKQNMRTAGQQYNEHCILDIICSKLKKIPPQFILGYYCEDQYGNETFIKNEQHYSNLNMEERETLFIQCQSNMNDFSKSINNLIATGNIEQLNQMKERIKNLGWNSNIVDNAIELVRKKQEQRSSKNNKREIILNNTNRTNEIARLKEMRNRILMLKNNYEEETKQNNHSR